MPRAYLSLGSNLDPESNLRSAVAALRERFGEVTVSPVYRTAAVGFEGPDFLNAAVVVETDLGVHALDAWLHALEDAHGRRRDVPRYSSRPLDIDIVFFDDLVLHEADAATGSHLQIPRPELAQAFVLKPMADIAPDFVDPVSGRTLAQLWTTHPDHAMGLRVAETTAE
jgi:2-amino-4-hydroxy-6-hydroxymethyldihydropteridine diphosphokinase